MNSNLGSKKCIICGGKIHRVGGIHRITPEEAKDKYLYYRVWLDVADVTCSWCGANYIGWFTNDSGIQSSEVLDLSWRYEPKEREILHQEDAVISYGVVTPITECNGVKYDAVTLRSHGSFVGSLLFRSGKGKLFLERLGLEVVERDGSQDGYLPELMPYLVDL